MYERWDLMSQSRKIDFRVRCAGRAGKVPFENDLLFF